MAPKSVPPTVAVCFAGWLNVAVPGAGATAREFMVDVLSADAFVAGTYLPRNWSGRPADCDDGGHECLLSKLVSLSPYRLSVRPMDTREDLSRAFERTEHFRVIEAESRRLGRSRAVSMLSPLLGRATVSPLRELRGYSRCLDLIETHERERGVPYDRVVFSRLEFNWLAPHPPLSLLPPCFVWVPRSHDGQPINDGHAVLPRSAASVYMRRWEWLQQPGLLRRAPLSLLATGAPEDLLAFVLAEAKLSTAVFAGTMALACCGAAGHCFRSGCVRAPLYSSLARRHAPDGEPAGVATDDRRGAKLVVRGKYSQELRLAWRHAAALACPGALFTLRCRHLRADGLLREGADGGGCVADPRRACAFRTPARFPPKDVQKRVHLVIRIPALRRRQSTPFLSGGLLVPYRVPMRPGRAEALPWYCPAHPSALWPSADNVSDARGQPWRRRAGAPPPQFSAAGYCEETRKGDEGDCARGSRGGWAAGWGSPRRIYSLQDCVDECARCQRCNFVSISFRPYHGECSWFHACPLFHAGLRRAATAPDMVTVDVRRARGRRWHG